MYFNIGCYLRLSNNKLQNNAKFILQAALCYNKSKNAFSQGHFHAVFQRKMRFSRENASGFMPRNKNFVHFNVIIMYKYWL